MQIHGPSAEFAAADVTVELNATRPQDPFITIMWPNGVRVYLDEGEADYLIKVILQAKDMLAAHKHAVACNAGLDEYVNGTTQATGEANQATHLDNSTDVRVKLCRCDRDPRSHVPWPGCPEWKDARGLPVAEGICRAGSVTHSWLCTRVHGHPGNHYTVTGKGELEWGADLPASKGLPAAEDDGGDGDDTREPYCTTCLFTVTAAGQHMYPDGVLMPAHETEIGWREPVGRPTGEDAQAAEVRRIGKLHTDGHITAAECAQMTDKVLGERA